jgi:hypothetical protein
MYPRPTSFLEAQILAEELHHMVLEAIAQVVGVCARVLLERVCDAVLVQHRVQLRGIDTQAILITDVQRDGAVVVLRRYHS